MNGEHNRETTERTPNKENSYTDDQVEQIKRFGAEFWAWIQLQKIAVNQWIQALASVALLGVTIGQLTVALSGSSQTEKLIDASNKNAAAAQGFAESARQISDEMNKAVSKLEAQNKLTDAVRESSVSASQRSLDATISNFRQAQRPIVMLSGTENLVLRAGQPVTMNVIFANFGRSPALAGMATDQIFVGKDALSEAGAYLNSLPLKRPEKATGSLWTLPPNPDCKTSTNGGLIFNCQFTTSTTFKRMPISDDEAALYKNNNDMVVFAGRWSYLDVSGTEYTTDYCLRLLAGGAIGLCNKYNDVR